jgi:hypothetical protein
MGCFSLGFLEEICIWIIVAIAFWKLWLLLSPYMLQFLPAIVVAIIQIVIWAIIAIFFVKIIFELLACVFGSGGISLGHSFH